MKTVDFHALEYRKDATFQAATYRYEGDTEKGWRILREGKAYLTLPPGYRLLKSIRCGVCSTDLSRHHLPFPLPQITGHEVIARDESGKTVAVEINASHTSTGSPLAASCPFCRQGLPTHCPDRLTLGIDRLPGGFAPWILVPERNIVEIPDLTDRRASVLIEPFAAALHATEQIDLTKLKRVAVLGSGRLGLLIVAALKGRRETTGGSFSIEAIDQQRERLQTARALGADRLWNNGRAVMADGDDQAPFDVVFESTGSPQGLVMALELASREVHLKSTTGLASLGLEHITELVVDEVSIGPLAGESDESLSSQLGSQGPALLYGAAIPDERARTVERGGGGSVWIRNDTDLLSLLHRVRAGESEQVGLVVVETLEWVDKILRPWPDLEQGLIRPRGTILLADVGQPKVGLLRPILGRGVKISTSRCGDFRRALPVMEKLVHEGAHLGALVTDTLSADELPQAFERARSPGSIKVVVDH
jgi:threonine dehydrogenase-like Zn-dependent dehydrogenase